MATTARITLDKALEQTRTGDIWLFRGHTLADRAIRVGTNSPVNHVGMSVVIEDLPPLMWHAELGRSLEDLWSGNRHRGVQLHDLRAAVLVWTGRYGQHAWLRQLEHPPLPGMEDALLRTIARLDGTPFPSTARLASRWLLGRLPVPHRPGHGPAGRPRGTGRPMAPLTDSRAPAGPWRPRTARRSWRPPTSPWACSPASASHSGMTPAGSGAATSWNCWPGRGWAARSPSRSPPGNMGASLSHSGRHESYTHALTPTGGAPSHQPAGRAQGW